LGSLVEKDADSTGPQVQPLAQMGAESVVAVPRDLDLQESAVAT
jgi:hypothetical protein